MPQITISDVAEEAGLSSSSVSRILRGGKGHVYSAPTVERVHEIARRLGYRANVAARMLSQGSQTMIGMSVHFTEHPYLNRFLVAVHQELLKQEFDPVLIDANHLSSEDTAQPFPPPHMLGGLISMGIDLQATWPQHYSSLAEHMPIVALQPISSEAAAWVDVVQVDMVDAFGQTFDYLTGIGHRDIAFLGVTQNGFPTDLSKMNGWSDAAKSRGLCPDYLVAWPIDRPVKSPVDPEVPGASDFIYKPNSRQTLDEVVEKLSAFPRRPTALMCASDEVALVLQSYLQAKGWSLPKDLSIIGYDGISLGEHVYPSLTTIAPNYERLAEQAVVILMERMKAEDWKSPRTTRTVLIPPKLLVRESSGPV